MKHNLTRSARALTVVAATTVAIGAFGGGAAFADPIALTPTPTSGTAGDNFTFKPVGATCSGNETTSTTFRASSYLVDSTVDASTLTFNSSGPGPIPGKIVKAAQKADLLGGGNRAVNYFLDASYSFTGVGQFDFATYVQSGGTYSTGVVSGNYKLGIACYNVTTGLIDDGSFTASTSDNFLHYWETPLYITSDATTSAAATTLSWGVPAAPTAPTIDLTAGDGSLSLLVNAVTALPPVTYSAVVTTGGVGGTPVAGSPFTVVAGTNTLPGTWVNGTAYTAVVTATNGIAPNGVSADDTATPAEVPYTAPGTPTVTSSVTNATTNVSSVGLTWTAPNPATGGTPVSYDVTVAGTGAGTGTFNTATNTYTATGLTPNAAYTFTVKAVYSPVHTSATSGTLSVTTLPASVVVQDVTTVRPAGALILTQRCGIKHPNPAGWNTTSAFGSGEFGMDVTSQTPKIDTNNDGYWDDSQTGGTAPTWNGSPDPSFSSYPVPAVPNYITKCNLDLGTTSLITTGPLAGQFYKASNAINEVSVSDFRDADNGWTVKATMSDFTTLGDSFSGNYLGWQPYVAADSNPAVTGEYNQLVTAGGSIIPKGATGGTGLGAAQTLATGAAYNSGANTGGIGITNLDAHVKLLIPADKIAGTYTGTLTFTLTPGA